MLANFNGSYISRPRQISYGFHLQMLSWSRVRGLGVFGPVLKPEEPREVSRVPLYGCKREVHSTHPTTTVGVHARGVRFAVRRGDSHG